MCVCVCVCYVPFPECAKLCRVRAVSKTSQPSCVVVLRRVKCGLLTAARARDGWRGRGRAHRGRDGENDGRNVSRNVHLCPLRSLKDWNVRDPPGRVGWHRHVGVGSDRTRDRAVTHPRREANVARRRARRCNANCVASSATAQRLVPRSVCERPAEPRGGAQAPRADTPKAEREMETRPPL